MTASRLLPARALPARPAGPTRRAVPLAPALLLALAGLPASGPVAARPQPGTLVPCASADQQYQYCPVRTGMQVTLERQRSRWPCRQGKTWGYDPNGIWVTQGCAADFRVGGPATGAGPDQGIGPVRPGLPPPRPMPGATRTRWAGSTYVGFDPGAPGEMRLTVDGEGRVQGSLGGHRFTGQITDTWLQTDRTRFRLQVSGTGFLATDERNPRHRIQFDLDAGRN